MDKSFRDLFVWQASVELSVRIIQLSDLLIGDRRYAIANQIVRSSFSVPSNIAEGEGRSTGKDRRHFLVQARGSLYELETQLEILARAGIASHDEETRTLIARIGAGLTRMIRHRSET